MSAVTGTASSLGRSIKRSLDCATESLNLIGAALIVFMMLMVNADVISRSLFDKPVPGVPEMVSTSIVAIVFLQAAHAFRMGRLTRATALPDLIGRHSIRARALLKLFLCAGAGIIMLQLLSASWPLIGSGCKAAGTDSLRFLVQLLLWSRPVVRIDEILCFRFRDEERCL